MYNIKAGRLLCKACCDKARSERYMEEVSQRLGGRVKRAADLGLKKTRALYVELACERCGALRWMQASHPKTLCNKCAAADRAKAYRGGQNKRWKGGKLITPQGYVLVRLYSDDPMYSMAGKWHHRVFEHRLVMARHLGRCLERWELVHHKGTRYPMDSKRDRQDNRIENLELLPNSVANISYARMKERIEELEKQVRLLKWQVRLLQQGNPVLSSSETLDKCLEAIHGGSSQEDQEMVQS